MEQLGTYTYKRFYGYDGYGAKIFREHTMRVKVVEEKYTRYRVQYLGADASKGAPNTLHWVQKKNVRLDNETPVQVKAAPVRDDIRLPYKDND